MTDLQFKDFLRGIVNDLKRVLALTECGDTEAARAEIDLMIKRFRAAIED